MTATEADELATVVTAALADAGRSLDALTIVEALDLSDRLHALADALPGPGAGRLRLAADYVEQAVGIA